VKGERVRLLASINLTFVVWMTFICSVLTIFGVICIARAAAASRNMILASATVISALVFFGLQGLIELRVPRGRDGIGGTLLLDLDGPAIRHVRGRGQPSTAAGMTTALRTFGEESARNVLASMQPRPDFSAGDNTSLLHQWQLLSDFAILSFLHYMRQQQPDWQTRFVTIDTPFGGTRVRVPTPSFTVRNCTDIDEQTMRQELRRSGNEFAEASLAEAAPLCLPPQSVMRIGRDSITITNPFLTISFRVQPRGGVPHMFLFDVTTEYSRLRSQHELMPEYRQWVERIIADARPWFTVPE
jgi:hypothetical protein